MLVYAPLITSSKKYYVDLRADSVLPTILTQCANIICSFHDDCWNLTVEPALLQDYVVSMRFITFELEAESTCAYDYLKIFCQQGNCGDAFSCVAPLADVQ